MMGDRVLIGANGNGESRETRLAASLSGTNLARAGDYNQRIVLQAVRQLGETTRLELAQITGLTAPTIANITGRLTKARLIKSVGRRRGGRGQPAVRIAINPNGCFAFGLNIDRDHLTLIVIDLAGQVRARRACEIAFALPDAVIEFVRSSIPSMVEEGKVDETKVLGIGVALPDELGHIALPHRPEGYEEWDRIDLEDLLAKATGWPVHLDNDAATAALGEAHLANGANLSSFFYLLVSAGLGGGLVIDRNYFRGADARSGEIGLMRDGTSAEGATVQDTVSLSALFARLEGEGLPAGKPGDLIDASPQAEKVIADWLDDAARVLTQPLVAVNCLINPDVVLIGGRLPGPIADALVARLNDSMARSSLPAIAPVRRSEAAEDAPAIGAAMMPFLDRILPSDSILMQAGRTT